MADDTRGARTRAAPRLLACTAVAVIGVLALTSPAFAATHQGPQITPRVATFTIPVDSPPSVSWTLNLWKRGVLVGSDTGTSGVLTVTIPRSINGTVQADVRRNGRWWSGARVAVTGGSGGGGPGTGGSSGGGGKKGGGGKNGGGGQNGGGGRRRRTEQRQPRNEWTDR